MKSSERKDIVKCLRELQHEDKFLATATDQQILSLVLLEFNFLTKIKSQVLDIAVSSLYLDENHERSLWKIVNAIEFGGIDTYEDLEEIYKRLPDQ